MQKANGKGQLQGPTPTAGSPGSNNSTNSATSAHGLGVAALPNGQAAKAAEQPQAAAMHLSGGMKRACSHVCSMHTQTCTDRRGNTHVCKQVHAKASA